MELVDRIPYMKGYFDEWGVYEKIIDDRKACWIISKPKSCFQKVCLFRDGENMFIYGDYGSYVFDDMTWYGSVYNINESNLRSLVNKTSAENREKMFTFDSDTCKKDIIRWLEEHLDSCYEISETEIQKIVSIFNDCNYIDDNEIELVTASMDDEIADLLQFIEDAMWHTGCKEDWTAFLGDEYYRLDRFDEAFESDLWNAGRKIDDKFIISLYALQICGEKLSKEKEAEFER